MTSATHGHQLAPTFDRHVVHRSYRSCETISTATRFGSAVVTSSGWFTALRTRSPRVWSVFSPCSDRSPDETLAYIVNAATAAERLRRRWPDKSVPWSGGGGLTALSCGIVPGKSLLDRIKTPASGENAKAGSTTRRSTLPRQDGRTVRSGLHVLSAMPRSSRSGDWRP